MSEAPKRTRRGKAIKEKRGAPAVFVPDGGTVEEAKAAAANLHGPFSALQTAERLNVWRLNVKEPTYFAPAGAGGDWREMSGGDLARFAKLSGVKMKAEEDAKFSQWELLLEFLHNERLVDFAGPLAGYQAGLQWIDSRPIIVRGGPRLVEPKAGEWPLIEAILKPRLACEDGPQFDLFRLWLKRFIHPMYGGRRRKGPLLILAGPNDAGKSFIQHHIITPVFGGRECDPTDFLKSEQGFNKSVMGSEHLAMGEFAFPLDGASRLMISEKLKKIVANDVHTYHPKGRDPVPMPASFRLSISINDNSEKLRALPPMNNDLSDKVILLKVRGGMPMPMPTNTDEEEEAFAKAVRAEIPAFVEHLLTWEPEETLAKGRFGMAAWQHPEIVDALWEQEPVSRFSFLLDRTLFPASEGKTHETWGYGKAHELHDYLTSDDCSYQNQFRGLLKYDGACAQMLGQLQKREGETIARARGVKIDNIDSQDEERRYRWKHGKTGNVWMIWPPKA